MNTSSSSMKPQTIITAVALVLVAIITYLLAMPQSQALKASKAILQAKQAEQKALEEKITALESFADTLPQYSSEIEKLAVAFPAKEQSVEALIQAQAIAEKSGTTVTSLVPGGATAGSLPVAMTLQGGFDRVSVLFKEINDNLRPIKVDTISLLSGGDKDNAVMNISIGANFLFSGAPAVAPVVVDPTAVAEPLPTTN